MTEPEIWLRGPLPDVLPELQPVAHGSDIRALIEAVRGVHVAQAIRQYIIGLVAATRFPPASRTCRSPNEFAAWSFVTPLRRSGRDCA